MTKKSVVDETMKEETSGRLGDSRCQMKLATPDTQCVSLYVRMYSCGGAQLLSDAQLCTRSVAASEFVSF